MQQNRGIILGIIVIIIGIVLSLVLIGFFTGQHPFGLKDSKKLLKLPCGVTIYHPKQYEEVTFPFEVSGYVNGCGWDIENNIAGVLTVLGDNGLIIAQGNLIPTGDVTEAPYYFSSTVAIDNPNMTRGTFVFSNGKTGFEERLIKIPVVFK